MHPFHSLWWRQNEREGVSNHRHLDCLLNCLFRCRSKKASKLHVTGLCEGNPPMTGGFPSQRASNMENVSIWLHHHAGWKIKISHEYWCVHHTCVIEKTFYCNLIINRLFRSMCDNIILQVNSFYQSSIPSTENTIIWWSRPWMAVGQEASQSSHAVTLPGNFNKVTWASWYWKLMANWQFVQQFVQSCNNKNIKTHITSPFSVSSYTSYFSVMLIAHLQKKVKNVWWKSHFIQTKLLIRPYLKITWLMI